MAQSKKFISPGAWFSMLYPADWNEFEDGEGSFLFYNPSEWTGNFRISAYKGNTMYGREVTRQELKDNPFSFSPSLKGKTYWVSNNIIEFVPEEGALKPGAFYEGTFHLGDFVDVDKKLEEFNFSFRVQERNFSIHTDPITVTATQPDQVTVTGEIRFSDVVKKEEVEKVSMKQLLKNTISSKKVLLAFFLWLFYVF